MIWQLLIVFAGGGLGSVCRYALGRAFSNSMFLWGTLLANFAACAVLGFLVGYQLKRSLPLSWKLLLATGFCGGFSTFSTFVLELVRFQQEGSPMGALVYLSVSLFGGVVCLLAGMWLGARMG